MQANAKDLMESAVLTVSPETPLLQVHRLFVEEEINGAPVVDDQGRVLGVISSLDLLRAVQEEYDSGAAATAPIYFREEMPYSGPDWRGAPEDFQDRMGELTAKDAMVREVVTVGPDTPAGELAALMRKQRIHRVLVVEDREHRGILSTFDLIRLLEPAEQPATPEELMNLDDLTAQCFFETEVESATRALEGARQRYALMTHLDGFSFEVVVPDGAGEAWVHEHLVRPLIYFCESKGAALPGCAGVFVSLFVGRHLYCISAGDTLGWAQGELGLTIEELHQRYGTHESEHARR
jgi:CBS domain-containing protein